MQPPVTQEQGGTAPGREQGSRSPDVTIQVSGVSVIFGEKEDAFQALSNIDFEARRGEFISLIGPSGCGKTTLLRVVSNLTAPTSGTVLTHGRSPKDACAAREVGFVFQAPGLLEWRDAAANVRLPLEMAGVARAEARERVAAMLGLVGLSEFADRMPPELSGGMQQRVSIARSLVMEPSVLLMDEPFGALDEFTRDRLNLELARICEQKLPTVLFVTHNIREAIYLSDRVLIFGSRPGRIVADLKIDLPRPRTLESRDAAAFADYVTEGQRVLRSVQTGD